MGATVYAGRGRTKKDTAGHGQPSNLMRLVRAPMDARTRQDQGGLRSTPSPSRPTTASSRRFADGLRSTPYRMPYGRLTRLDRPSIGRARSRSCATTSMPLLHGLRSPTSRSRHLDPQQAPVEYFTSAAILSGDNFQLSPPRLWVGIHACRDGRVSRTGKRHCGG